MAIRDLPDMYALSPQALGLRPSNIGHTYQANPTYVTTITYVHILIQLLSFEYFKIISVAHLCITLGWEKY